jgi:hypothetical protein
LNLRRLGAALGKATVETETKEKARLWSFDDDDDGCR